MTYARLLKVLMTWMWLIPSFHIASETPSTSIVLTRNELDFPIGIGKDILDVEVKMEWCCDEAEASYDAQVEATPADEPSSGMETVMTSLAGGIEVGQAVE
jgi:phosphatidylinositol-3,4,5-trisphosphate 3-phosphatase/dual-specificity protein phosphatase PTEN